MSNVDALRRFYARLIASTAGVSDPRIIEAFARVKREQFVGPGPWQIRVATGYISTETDDPAVLYQDILVGLVPDEGINNGEPSLHAKAIAAAAPLPGDTVIHVGAGTGYYTAILAHLVGPSGRVQAFEIHSHLARRAAQNLSSVPTVTVVAQSALEASLPIADVIYVSAGATHLPSQWLDALRHGGRLVLPLTPTERAGFMLLVTRRNRNAFSARAISPAVFIACAGARDDAESRALAETLDSRSPDQIRSLRRGDSSDDSAWYVGRGWWLSTAEPE
jgi:protein-L-isoaspartate(D-aspartate) O-methyltransferase